MHLVLSDARITSSQCNSNNNIIVYMFLLFSCLSQSFCFIFRHVNYLGLLSTSVRKLLLIAKSNQNWHGTKENEIKGKRGIIVNQCCWELSQYKFTHILICVVRGRKRGAFYQNDQIHKKMKYFAWVRKSSSTSSFV